MDRCRSRWYGIIPVPRMRTNDSWKYSDIHREIILSIAEINASNRFRGFASVIIGDREFTAPPLSLKFTLAFGTGRTPPSGSLTMINPSDETIDAATPPSKREYPPVFIDAGYRNDHGTVFAGEIHSVKTSGTGTERIMTCKITVAGRTWSHGKVYRTYAPGITPSFIFNDILRRSGLNAGNFAPVRNPPYLAGYSIAGRLAEALPKIAADMGCVVYFNSSGQVFCEPEAGGLTTVAVITPEQIIGQPTRTKDGLKLNILFDHRAGPGQFFQIRSDSLSVDGLFKLKKGKHKYDSASKRITELEVVG